MAAFGFIQRDRRICCNKKQRIVSGVAGFNLQAGWAFETAFKGSAFHQQVDLALTKGRRNTAANAIPLDLGSWHDKGIRGSPANRNVIKVSRIDIRNARVDWIMSRRSHQDIPMQRLSSRDLTWAPDPPTRGTQWGSPRGARRGVLKRSKTLTRPERGVAPPPLIHPTGPEGFLDAAQMSTTGEPRRGSLFVNGTTPIFQGAKAGKNGWKVGSYAATFWVPDFVLRWIGGMRTAMERQAWREKWTVVMVAVLLGAIMGFFTVGLNRVLCPGGANIEREMTRPLGSGDRESSIHFEGTSLMEPQSQLASRATNTTYHRPCLRRTWTSTPWPTNCPDRMSQACLIAERNRFRHVRDSRRRACTPRAVFADQTAQLGSAYCLRRQVLHWAIYKWSRRENTSDIRGCR